MSNFHSATAMCLIMIAGTAKADWQYTKWGMNPAQVAAASKGSVSVGKGDPKEEYAGTQIGASGTYSSGEYKFDVVFHFKAGELVDVRLKLVGGERYALKQDLMGAYGKPFYEGGKSLDLTTWHDQAKNNRVDLLMIGPDYTSVGYRPLKDSSSAGL